MPRFNQRLFSRFCAEQFADGGQSGGGSAGIAPDVQAMIDAKVNEAVTGLRAKNGELIGKLKEANSELQRFSGIDPDAVRNILSKFASDEEAGLISAGKLDEVIVKRTDRMKADFDKKLAEEHKERDRFVAANKKLSARALSEAIIKAATKAGAKPEALDDVVNRARDIWNVNEDGDVVAMNGQEIVLGKDGKTPLSPIEWAESLRETASHLWPMAQGSNAPGSGAASKAGIDFSKLPPAERMSKAREMGMN